MNVLSIVLTAFAVLAAAIALTSAVAALLVQWKDRSSANKDAGTELWLYAAVFGFIFLLTLMGGGLAAQYGAGVEIFAWAIPALLCLGWLASRFLKSMRKRFNRESAFDDNLDPDALLADLQLSHTQFAKLDPGRPPGFDHVVQQGAEAFRFVTPSKAQTVDAGADEPESGNRESRHKPPADALYFRESRRFAKFGLSLTGLQWFRDLAEAEGGMALAVEARGIHIGAIGSIQAGTAFFPWAAMKSVVSMRPGTKSEGGTWLAMADRYRKYPCKAGYLLIPGPLWFEDRQAFLHAVGRFAPEGNPLRTRLENRFFRAWFLWFDRVVLALVMVGVYLILNA